MSLCFLHSEAGHQHFNEDVVEVRPHPCHGDVWLCALADGQGGQAGGVSAARLAVGTTLKLAASYPAQQLLDTATWYGILSAADEAVNENQNAGYTTLIGLCVAEGKVCGVSCGDSAVLLIRQGRDLLLTERQRKNPPVGSGAAFPVAFSASLGPDWKLLVMSDGVWKYIGWNAIMEIVVRNQGQSLITALRRLSWEQNAGKLPDDWSVALLQEAIVEG